VTRHLTRRCTGAGYRCGTWTFFRSTKVFCSSKPTPPGPHGDLGRQALAYLVSCRYN